MAFPEGQGAASLPRVMVAGRNGSLYVDAMNLAEIEREALALPIGHKPSPSPRWTILRTSVSMMITRVWNQALAVVLCDTRGPA
jgi:hypothetical protein